MPGLNDGAPGLSQGSGLSYSTGLYGGTVGLEGGSIPVPVVQTNLLTSTSLPSWLTWTNPNGHRMVYDSSGYLTWAPNNLITKGTTLASPWVNDGITVTTGVSDPDGGTNACTLAATKTNAERYIAVSESGAANYYAINGCYMRKRSGAGGVKLYNPLGTLANSYTLTDSWQWLESPKSLGSAGIGGGGGFYFFFHIDTSGDEIDIYTPVICKVTHQTTIPTASKQLTVDSQYYGPRWDYDPSGPTARGLLIEESRQNLCVRSNDFANWPVKINVTTTAGDATGPDGTSSATKLVMTSGGFMYTDNWYPTAGTYNLSISIWLKGTNNGDKVAVRLNDSGNSNELEGVFTLTTSMERYTLSGSLVASGGGIEIGIENRSGVVPGLSGSAVTVWAYGYQLEVGSFPTSCIPTTSAGPVTRNAETVTFAGDAQTLLRSVAYSAIMEIETESIANNARIIGATAATASPMYADTTNSRVVVSDGTNVVDTDDVIAWANATRRIAYGQDATGRSVTVNGNNVGSATDAYYTAANSNTWVIGSYSGSEKWSGWVRGNAFYNARLSDALLKSKSTVGGAY